MMEKPLIWLVVIVGISFTLVNGMAILERQKRQNYDALLQNKAFVESQINCVLGRGQCDRIGHRIKILVPEVVKTNVCKSCSEEEKGNVKKVADHVQVHYPKAWNEIRVQYKDEQEQAMEEEEMGVEESGEVIVDETSENSVGTDPSSTLSPKDEETKGEKDDENQQEALDSNNPEPSDTNNQEPSQDSENSSQQLQPESETEQQEGFLEESRDVVDEQKVQEEVNMENKKDAVDTDADSVTN